jgi:hypothetical protein
MGLKYNEYINADRVFGCDNCKTHLAAHDSIISRVSCLIPNTLLRALATTLTTHQLTSCGRISVASTERPISSRK